MAFVFICPRKEHLDENRKWFGPVNEPEATADKEYSVEAALKSLAGVQNLEELEDGVSWGLTIQSEDYGEVIKELKDRIELRCMEVMTIHQGTDDVEFSRTPKGKYCDHP